MSGDIKDYQMSAFLMAVCINDMSDQEVIDLTKIFINSGDIIDLSGIDGVVVDKHSTGGVGDKTTLILAPLVASCGVKVAKMSGRGLGHTGGTIDKLASIPGFNINLTNEQFVNQVNSIGIALVSQTGNLVPADKKIYALRDVTATTSSIPLIAISIMSKKIASGASKIVIDLKVGNGALIKNLEEARRLAKLMIKIGKSYEKEVICVLTNMNRPLGLAIGNTLEVIETIDVLNRKGPNDVRNLVINLGTFMVSMGLNISIDEAKSKVIENLDNKLALSKFSELVKSQNGDLSKLKLARKVASIKSPKTGFINNIDALKLGELARELGAGRINKEDEIDYEVGFVLSKQVGDYVIADEELIIAYIGKKDITPKEIVNCFEIEKSYTNKEPLIYEIIK
jgi:pyrimidine-nucleoside phosphorylase